MSNNSRLFLILMALDKVEILGYSLPLNILAGVGAGICALLFFLELYKYWRYRTHNEMLDLSGMGVVLLGIFAISADIILAVLVAFFIMMVLGTYEIREGEIWFRLMLSFTIMYGYVFLTYLLSLAISKLYFGPYDISGFEIDQITIKGSQIFGFGYSTSIYVLLFVSLILFGKRYLLVSRFMSPAYVYIALWAVAYALLLQLKLDWEYRYVAIFLVNSLLYLASGPLLRFLFRIEELPKDHRVVKLVEEVQQKLGRGTKLTHIGVVKAPILNALAFGAFFDQRIAFVARDKNLTEYSDEEIKGIAAHELVHTKYKHTLILLGVTLFELFIRHALDVPATAWEYAFNPDEALEFWVFYLFNISLAIVLFIFVRMLEAQADRVTRSAGYGRELIHSLFRLESFYQGIIGQLGLSAQLLTGRERSEEEKTVFMGNSADLLRDTLMDAPLWEVGMNLIMSHPLSAYRIAALLDPSIGPIRSAFMPLILLIPGMRRRTKNRLQKLRPEFDKILTEKFVTTYGAVDKYSSLVNIDYGLQQIKGRSIIAIPRYDGFEVVQGKLIGVTKVNSITEPVQVQVVRADKEGEEKITEFNVCPACGGKIESDSKFCVECGEVVVEERIVEEELLLKTEKVEKICSPYTHKIHIAELETQYLLKNGKIGILKEINLSKNKKIKSVLYEIEGKEIKRKEIGIPLKDLLKLDNGGKILFHRKGFTELASVQSFVPNHGSWKKWKINMKFTDTEITYQGKDLIFSPPPILFLFKKKKWDNQRSILEWMQQNKIPSTLYTLDDIEVGKPGYIELINEEEVEIILGAHREKINYNKLEGLVLPYRTFLFYIRNEIGFGTILQMKWSNRRSHATKYVM